MILTELDQSPERDNLVASLSEGLAAQAAWLYIAGSHAIARHAHLLARCMPALPLAANPILTRLVATGLQRTRTNRADPI